MEIDRNQTKIRQKLDKNQTEIRRVKIRPKLVLISRVLISTNFSVISTAEFADDHDDGFEQVR